MNNNCGGMLDQPDPDAIKMFVGQIPRSMDEEKLRVMFEEFGKVHQINVLRDKVTSQSKGEYPQIDLSLVCRVYFGAALPGTCPLNTHRRRRSRYREI